MPFRRAHYWLLPLFPIVVVAFWPGYFGDLRGAPVAFHLHGMVATAWLALVVVQSWTVERRRFAAHRAAGLAMFAVVPLFAAAGLLVVRGMAELGATRADPFHTAFGARLALDDLVSVATFLALTGLAVARRRRVALHAGAMVATTLLLLPPIFGRLFAMLPGFGGAAAMAGLHPFALAFELAQLMAVCLALSLARRHRASASPLMAVAVVIALESLLFETVGRTDGWRAIVVATLAVPAPLLALAGLAVGGAVMAAAWTAAPPAPRRRAAVA